MLRLGRLVFGRLLFACANYCACVKRSYENKFSKPHYPTPTIYDCNNLPSVCSRLLPPFELYSWKFDNLPRCGTSQATFSVAFFVRLKALVQLVAPRQSCLRLCYCSVGVLLRNRRFCVDSQKVNKFPFNYHPNPCNFVVRLRSNFTLLALLSASAAVRAI